MRITRSLAALLLTLLVAGFGVVGAASPAQAAPVSKFWMYFHVDEGEFVAYNEGVGATKPEDGTIEAYRYGASEDFPPHIAPRADLTELTFEAICGHVEAVEGQKRVGVLIDFGVDQDAPDGEETPAPYAACAQVAANANGLQVLEGVADVRAETSDFGPSLCGIDGYPAAGPCFGTADEVSPADADPVAFPIAGVDAHAADDDDDDDTNWPLLAGVGALVVVIGAGGVILARRNRAA